MFWHEVTDADLMAFADGQLGGKRAARVSRYLRTHPEAADKLREYIRQDYAIHQAFDPVLREPVPSRLKALVRDSFPGRPGPVQFMYQLTATAFVLAILLAGWHWTASFEESAPRTTMLDNDFSHYVLSALETAEKGNPGQAGVSATGRHGPDLSGHGYESHTRRELRADNRTLLEFIYQDKNQQRLWLYVDQETARHPGVRFMQRGDMRIALWQQDGVRYALVGRQDIPELSTLVDAARTTKRTPRVVRPSDNQPHAAARGQHLPNTPAADKAQGQELSANGSEGDEQQKGEVLPVSEQAAPGNGNL